MKFLKKFNESSISVKNFKWRRDEIPNEIDDILLNLKDESLDYKVSWPTSDLKKIEIDLVSSYMTKFLINKIDIESTLHHLCDYLASEGFVLTFSSFDYKSSESNRTRQGRFDITTPEFSFDEFFDLLPESFMSIFLIFNYED